MWLLSPAPDWHTQIPENEILAFCLITKTSLDDGRVPLMLPCYPLILIIFITMILFFILLFRGSLRGIDEPGPTESSVIPMPLTKIIHCLMIQQEKHDDDHRQNTTIMTIIRIRGVDSRVNRLEKSNNHKKICYSLFKSHKSTVSSPDWHQSLWWLWAGRMKSRDGKVDILWVNIIRMMEFWLTVVKFNFLWWFHSDVILDMFCIKTAALNQSRIPSNLIERSLSCQPDNCIEFQKKFMERKMMRMAST